MHLLSICQVLLIAIGATALPASPMEHSAPQGLSDDKRLYQGPHMPPGLRHRPRLTSLHRREVPYGGVISFGDQRPCSGCASVQKATKSPHRLLGLVDLDIGVHL
ncbi:hypothetical protein IW140_003845 [Coemansia sp. RSA 1813]|nr:hypothetical protein EV178_005808 [Coemansia sp. RSA 1646]KAJ1764922.1 hypothetical protein LPJ74_006536 [Coemansia sp. RSA 1843]KAJ2086394.1 hypothetical protein IW138_005722 [Coemansia sp. RSA 986]KAJ2215673.1 hypothetical protein EV179_001897 [Coemansia sp. RSA 487]KAJ2568417.1 hypothetical protein IW140_003845 [Coemansia sp. RSA 1813]